MLWEAGQRTIPGGGAEILAARVRRKLGARKGGPDAWLEVHEAAHRIGFRTTATMMYGSIETAAESIAHLDAVRAAQDRAREIWRLRFSRIINPRATGNGEDCTGCSRALSEGPAQPNLTVPAGSARREIAAILKAAC